MPEYTIEQSCPSPAIEHDIVKDCHCLGGPLALLILGITIGSGLLYNKWAYKALARRREQWQRSKNQDRQIGMPVSVPNIDGAAILAQMLEAAPIAPVPVKRVRPQDFQEQVAYRMATTSSPE